MKRRAKHPKFPGLSTRESAQLLHAIGRIGHLERPNLYASALLFEARGILRALQRQAKSRKATFASMIDALDNMDVVLAELREGGVS